MLRYLGFLIVTTILGCQATRDPVKDSQKVAVEDEPTVQVTGLPVDYSRDTKFTANLAGEGIISYKFKIDSGEAGVCESGAGYSSPFPLVPTLEIDVNDLVDGAISFCILGMNADGVWQTPAKATSITWIKKTVGPISPVASLAIEGSNAIQLFHQAIDGYPTLIFRSTGQSSKDLPIDGVDYQIGDSVGDSLTLVYKGFGTEFLDSDLSFGNSYFYYVIQMDPLGNYSLPIEISVLQFGQPYAWIPNGLEVAAYESAIIAGSDVVDGNTPRDLFFCRAEFDPGKVIPGQLIYGDDPSSGTCYAIIPGPGGSELRTSITYEVLVSLRESFTEYFVWQEISYDSQNLQTLPSNYVLGSVSDDVEYALCSGVIGNLLYPGRIANGFERCSAPVASGDSFVFSSFEAWQVLTLASRPEL